MLRTVITAFISFISTNIDDIFVLMLFFSQVNHAMKRTHIVMGQYLGMGALIILSIMGAIGVSLFPHEYVGLLGFLPVYMGIKAYADHKKEMEENILPQEKQGFENIKLNEGINPQRSYIIHPNIIKVASVTLANGGDNVGIYIPLFSSMGKMSIFVTLFIFILLIALWCLIALKLAAHPFVESSIEKYKHRLIPIVFIGLGIFILLESGTLQLITKSVF